MKLIKVAQWISVGYAVNENETGEKLGLYSLEHYVTITGVYIDDVKNETFFRVSSWGREYYIKYRDYIEYVNEFSSYLFSNILYIG